MKVKEWENFTSHFLHDSHSGVSAWDGCWNLNWNETAVDSDSVGGQDDIVDWYNCRIVGGCRYTC